MTPPDITPQQRRENPDPFEKSNPLPWPMLVLAAVLMAFGIVYILRADIESPSAWGDSRTSAELSGEKKDSSSGGGKVDGAAIYASLCVACHQASGLGLSGVFPPLAGSEWVMGKDTTAAAILLHGINGAITVKGMVYKGAMPAFKDQLSDAQIAAVLTHVRSQWGNTAAPVALETVATTREALKERTAAFDGDKELPPHQ